MLRQRLILINACKRFNQGPRTWSQRCWGSLSLRWLVLWKGLRCWYPTTQISSLLGTWCSRRATSFWDRSSHSSSATSLTFTLKTKWTSRHTNNCTAFSSTRQGMNFSLQCLTFKYFISSSLPNWNKCCTTTYRKKKSIDCSQWCEGLTSKC